jgi:hypothetical protein
LIFKFITQAIPERILARDKELSRLLTFGNRLCLLLIFGLGLISGLGVPLVGFGGGLLCDCHGMISSKNYKD